MRRPLTALAVLAVLVALVIVHHHHGSAPATVTTTPTSSPAPGGTTTPTTGATTTTAPTRPAPPSDRLPSQSAYPAYAHLPYTGPNVQAFVTGTAPGGRFDVEVFSPTLSVADERALFAAFLARYHDDGSHYVVDYVTLAGAPPVAPPTAPVTSTTG